MERPEIEHPVGGWNPVPDDPNAMVWWDGTAFTHEAIRSGDGWETIANDSSMTPPMPGTETWGAGWKRDPSGRFDYRYWNGIGWTDQVSQQGEQLTAPVRVPVRSHAMRVVARSAVALLVGFGLVLVAAGSGLLPEHNPQVLPVVALLWFLITAPIVVALRGVVRTRTLVLAGVMVMLVVAPFTCLSSVIDHPNTTEMQRELDQWKLPPTVRRSAVPDSVQEGTFGAVAPLVSREFVPWGVDATTAAVDLARALEQQGYSLQRTGQEASWTGRGKTDHTRLEIGVSEDRRTINADLIG